MVNKRSEQVSSHKQNFIQSKKDLNSKRVPKDITWTNVNYKVGGVQILSTCWGKVKITSTQNQKIFLCLYSLIQVEAGTVCAILGPSGAGKSSLLNVLAGRSSTSGETSIDGMVRIMIIVITIHTKSTQITLDFSRKHSDQPCYLSKEHSIRDARQLSDVHRYSSRGPEIQRQHASAR